MRDSLLALLLAFSMASGGCASRAYPPGRPATRPVADASLMSAYVRQLPVGARVRVSLADGRTLHGTLMNAGDPIVLLKRTRIPEAPLEIALHDVRAVEIESQGGNAGRAIAFGAAAGAASALGVLLVLAAIFSD